MVPTLLLSVTGGLLVWRVQSRRRRPTLVERLAPPPAPVHTTQTAIPSMLLTDEQNLALSISLLGMTVVGHLGVPLLRLLSMPGLLYLDFYFICAAYADWQRQRQIGIATNDAVLATGLLATRQWGAGSLFATLFFASRKLQALTEARLAHGLRSTAVGGQEEQATAVAGTEQPAPVLTADKPAWQSRIDRGALPLLILSAASTPLLGLKRTLAVLLTNFGYDYRLVSPLSTLRYLKTAGDQGIWLCDPNALDRLQQVDVLVLDGEWDAQQVAALQPMISMQILTMPALATAPEAANLVADLQAKGRTVAYLATTLGDTAAATGADLLITIAQAPGTLVPPGVHVVLPTAAPMQIQQLFTLTQALAATRQRGLYLALAPGLLNLGGIYFGRFGVILALLVDYGGTALGILNATWLSLDAAPQRFASTQLFLQDLTATGTSP